MNILTTTKAGLREIEEKIAACHLFGFDYECTSSHPHKKAPLHHDKLKPVGFSFGFPDGDKTYVPIAHAEGPNAPESKAIPLLHKVLPDPANIVYAHNLKYEQMVSHVIGTKIANGRCSMLAQYLLGKELPGNKGLKLKPAVLEYLGRTMETWEEISGDRRAHEVPSDRMASYGADDGLGTLDLGLLWKPELESYGLTRVFEELECPFVDVLVHMREVGFAIDRDLLLWLNEEFSDTEDKLREEFYALTKVPISSNQKVSRRLYRDLKWWPTQGISTGKSGDYSVGAPARKLIEFRLRPGTPGHRALMLKNEYAKMSKLNSTYTHTLVSKADLNIDGRLRCDFNQARTATGRLSSSDPNLQNIPGVGSYGEAIREAFIAETEWCLTDADYSQADLRMMAHLSQDPMLLKAYREGIDLHLQTATQCQCPRKVGKVLNLGEIYEMGPRTFANSLGISLDLATMYHNNWHGTYPYVKVYQDRMHAYARKHGYVKTITGRVRFLPKIYSKNRAIQAMAEREASNCLDEETEALTRRGWVKGFELTMEDELLTKNPDTNRLEWQRPRDMKFFPDYSGELIEFTTRNFSAVTTPEHRWLVTNKADRKSGCVVSEDLSNHGDHRIHRTGQYEETRTFWLDSEVQLIGWFLTDGSSGYYKGVTTGESTRLKVMQSRRANPKNVGEIHELVKEVPGVSVSFYERERDTLCIWALAGRTARKIIHRFPDRVLDIKFLSEISASQCQLLFDTMMKGDGSRGTKDSFCASSRKKIEAFQALGVLCGKVVSIKYRDMSMYEPYSDKMPNVPKMTGCWYANILKRDTVQVLAKHKTFHPGGTRRGVWCPVVPNTYFVARRNGTVYITGNTPDQGSVADVMKIAMRNLYREWDSRGVLFNYWTKEGKAKILSQVHDEILCEFRSDFVEEGRADLIRHMENAVELRVPMKAEAGKPGRTWLEAYPD